MVLYNLKLAARILYRQKFYGIITILGFALGIAVFLFISIYILDHYSYDRWVDKRDRIYRLEKADWAVLGTAYGPFMVRTLPEVENAARVSAGRHHSVLQHKDDLFSVNNIVFADSTITDIFSFSFIAGDPESALTNPRSIVLTKSLSQTIFRTTDVMGNVLRFNDMENLVVTGVIEDVDHFHIETAGLMPFHLLDEFYHDDENFLNHWGNWNFLTYVLVAPNTDIEHLENKVNEIFYEEILATLGVEVERDFFLRPLSDVYFADDIKHVSPTLSGNKQTVRIFVAVAVFILLIAVVNFINLSTARSSLRAREVGVRRLLGSHRKNLVMQFLSESVLITTLAVILALVFVETGLPWFKSFADVSLHFIDIGFLSMAGILIAGTIIVGVFAGIYPSIYFTSFQPVDVLKGQTIRGKKGAFFRKALITFQFVISIILITSTIVISGQLRYMQEKDLGIRLEDNVVFSLNQQIFPRRDAFKSRLTEHHGISDIALSSQFPGQITWQESAMGNSDESKQYTMMTVDAEYLSMMGIEPLAGRIFSRDYPSDHQESIVLNEQAVRYFEYEGSYEDVVGQSFDNGLRIIGVVPDFHFNSLHNTIAPLVILWNDERSYNATVNINSRHFAGAISYIETVWHEFAPAIPFEYNILEEMFDRNYKHEKQLNTIFKIFSVFAIVIACLGLFGLSSFMAERRTRELALRKVMGADMSKLVFLLLKDFLKLVALAFVIAAPISWLFLTDWLDNFPYSISITAMPFIIAAVVAVSITMITVSYHAIRASLVNPGNVLKYE